MGNVPVCMSQYKNIFNACRVPADPMDSLLTEQNANHVTVVRNGQFFQIDAYNENGEVCSCEEIYGQLLRVVDMAHPTHDPIGIATSQKRDAWSATYNELMKSLLADIFRRPT